MLAIFLECENLDSTATGSLVIFQNRSLKCNSDYREKTLGTLDCEQVMLPGSGGRSL